MNIAHLPHRRALRTLVIACAERLKSLFVQAKCTQTLFIRTIHVSKDINNAVVKPIIRGQCTTHRECSQIFHTRLQRNLDS